MTRSPLHAVHNSLGARFTDFGGWEMPLHYGSVIAEHRAVRESAGVFDVTHLGRFELTGLGAGQALRLLLSNDIARVEPGRCQYTLMLNDHGGIEDDLLVWWWEPGRYWLLPNASNHEKVMAAFAIRPEVEVVDLRDETVMLAVQGPEALQAMEALLGKAPGRYRTDTTRFGDATVFMAGTGYTGERGGELVTDPATAETIFTRLVEEGVAPCGLGARDTLRLETGLPLWGDDIDTTTTPIEAGLDFAVAMEGREFVGHHSIAEKIANPPHRRLIGFVVDDRGVPRKGHTLRTRVGEGVVTSGNMSPLLEHGIGLGYVAPPPHVGEAIEVDIRGRWIKGTVTKPPFHKAGS